MNKCRRSIDELDGVSALHTTYAHAALSIVGSTFAIVQWHFLHSKTLAWLEAIVLSSGIATAVVARIWRKRWTPRISSILFAVNLCPIFAMIWIIQDELAHLGQYWVPFEPHQLSVLAIAMMAPPQLWAGLFGIVGMVALALVQYQQFPEQARALMPRGELGTVIAFGLFALILLVFRMRGRRKEREAARAREQARTARKLTRVVLAVRDLVNSPVQTLTLDTELIRRKYPDSSEVADRIRRSVERLQQLNAVVAKQADVLLHQNHADLSIDSEDILKKLHLD